jgi:hypothetical protein
MSGRLRVVVATTDGPSTIRRITPEDPDLRSVVCLAGTATALPISADYDAFVRRPTGVVERDTGHRAFRVDVDRPIDGGRSWQLGLYVAHRLKAAGRLAEDDQPADGIVWATGTVDADLKVGPVDRVADKARRSAALFGADLPVLAVAAATHAEVLPSGAERLAVRRMEEVLVHLGLSPEPVARPAGSRRIARVAAPSVTALAILALAMGAWRLWGDVGRGEQPEQGRLAAIVAPAADPTPAAVPPAAVPLAAFDPAAFDPADVVFEVLEARAEGGICGDGRVIDPAVASEPGVCAVAFRATNTGARPARLWLYAAIQGGVREYASRRRHTELASGMLDPGEIGEVRVQPPDWVRRPVVVRGLLILAAEERPQIDRALVSVDMLPSEDVDTLVAGLRDLDVDVREIFHRVTPRVTPTR